MDTTRYSKLAHYVKKAHAAIPAVKPWYFRTALITQIVSTIMKLTTLFILLEVGYSHKWIINYTLSPNFIITRDIFLNDCVYSKVDGMFGGCIKSMDKFTILGYEFGRDHRFSIELLSKPSTPLKFAEPVYYALLLLGILDFTISLRALYFNKQIVPKYETKSSGEIGFSNGGKLFIFQTFIAIVMSLAYIAMGWIIDNLKCNGLSQPTDWSHDTCGPAITTFASSCGTYVASVLAAALAWYIYKQDDCVSCDEETKELVDSDM